MSDTAAAIAEQAIAKIEAEEAGIIPPEVEDDKKGADDDKAADAKDDTAGKAQADGDDSGKSGDSGAADTEDDAAGAADGKAADDEAAEGEFTADDALEVDAKDDTKEAVPADQGGIQLSPDEQKYIVDNIGDPLTITGIVGEGENAKEVTLKAYSLNDLPQGFNFKSHADMLAAQSGFQGLETKAQSLVNNYRANQTRSQQADFERRENESIRADVAELQKAGRFPKFKLQPGSEGFDNDPAAQTMSEVLKFMAERNDSYLKQYEQGRAYKHIGFAEAYELWEAKNPQKRAERKADADQAAEDKAREKQADDARSNRSANASNIRPAAIKSGVTVNDILNRYDAEEW